MMESKRIQIISVVLISIAIVLLILTVRGCKEQTRDGASRRLIPSQNPSELSELPPATTVTDQPLPSVDDISNDASGSQTYAELLVTREDDGSPVEGAEIFFHDREWFRIGLTATDGRIGVPDDIIAKGGENLARRVVIQKAGFITHREDLNLPRQGFVEIELANAGIVSGRLVFPNGDAVTDEVLVYASGRPITDDALAAASSGFPALDSVYSDAEGFFEFKTLDPFRRYGFSAGGNGYAMHPVTQYNVRTPAVDREEVVIVVAPIYGAVVEVREAGGGALRTDRDLMSSNDILIPPLVADRFWVMPDTTSFKMARVFDWSKVAATAFVLPLIFTPSEGGIPSDSRANVTFKLPFYREKKVDVPLGVIGEDYSPFVVELDPVSTDFATVRVDFRWPDELLETRATAPTGAFVFPRAGKEDPCGALFVCDATGKPIAFQLVEIGDPSIELTAPIGGYRLKFVSTTGWFEMPPAPDLGRPVQLREVAPPVLFDFRQRSGVKLSVNDPYELGPGNARLNIQRVAPGDTVPRYSIGYVNSPFFGGSVRFGTRESQLLFPMSAGEYTASVSISKAREGVMYKENLGSVEFSIEEGRIEPYVIEWPPH